MLRARPNLATVVAAVESLGDQARRNISVLTSVKLRSGKRNMRVHCGAVAHSVHQPMRSAHISSKGCRDKASTALSLRHHLGDRDNAPDRLRDLQASKGSSRLESIEQHPLTTSTYRECSWNHSAIASGCKMASSHSYELSDQQGSDRLLSPQQSSVCDVDPPQYQYSSGHGGDIDKRPRLSVMRKENCMRQGNGPKKIQRDKMDLLADVVMSLIPVCFFVLLVFTVSKHKQPMDPMYDVLENATKVVCQVHHHSAGTRTDCISQASTIFPLAFAAVVGYAIKQVARLRLEMGAPLGLLEQLMGSRTVFGTLATQYQMRYSTSLGLLFVLLWSLSPLGGQAAIRFLGHANATDLFTNGTITYFDTTLQPSGWFDKLGAIYSTADLTQLQYVSNISALAPNVHLVYSTTIMSPDSVKIGAVDAWGNVKIPMLRTGLPDGGTEWTFYNDSSRPDQTYSALVGIPIAHLRAETISSNIESTYIELTCNNFPSVQQPISATSTCLQSAVKQ